MPIPSVSYASPIKFGIMARPPKSENDKMAPILQNLQAQLDYFSLTRTPDVQEQTISDNEFRRNTVYPLQLTDARGRRLLGTLEVTEIGVKGQLPNITDYILSLFRERERTTMTGCLIQPEKEVESVSYQSPRIASEKPELQYWFQALPLLSQDITVGQQLHTVKTALTEQARLFFETLIQHLKKG